MKKKFETIVIPVLSRPRFRAFTLVEMIVSMVITMIIVTIAFYGLQLVMNHYKIFQQSTSTAGEYQHFKALIRQDMTQSSWTERLGDSLLACRREEYTIHYVILKEKTLRKVVQTDSKQSAGFTDTFAIRAILQTASFEGRSIDQGLADHCLFQLEPFGEKQFFSIQKIYSAQERLQFDRNHEH